MSPAQPNQAPGLVVRLVRQELAERSAVKDHLEAEIDNWPGKRGPELNRLVERYIDARCRCEELEREIARVDRGQGPITG